MTISASQEVNALLRRQAPSLAAVIIDLATSYNSGMPISPAMSALAEYLAQTLGMSTLLGMRRTFLIARGMGADLEGPGVPPPGASPPGVGAGGDLPGGWGIPKVSYPEAVRQLASREPRLISSIPGGGPLDVRMGRLYQEGGFSLAKATSEEVISKVQDVVRKSIEEGGGRLSNEALIAEMGDWSRAYANIVYRNNVNTAYTAGVFEGMRDPDVRAVIGALMFDAILDSNTTEICRAFHGTIAPPGHEIWDERTTPCHHGCRSGVTPIDWKTLERGGHVRNGRVIPFIPNRRVKPAPGFGGRRDLPILGPRP